MQSKPMEMKTSLTYRPRALPGNLQDLAYKYYLVLDEPSFKRLTKRLGICDLTYMPEGSLGCCVIYEEEGVAIICLKEEHGLSLYDVYSILIHEAVHLWQAHCKWMGEEKPGDETEAYAIQKIAGELIKEYGKFKFPAIKLAKEGVSGQDEVQDCSGGTQVREESPLSYQATCRGPELS